MNQKYARYQEIFPEDFSVKHKIAPYTEKKSFHLHTQFELIFTRSDNLICRQESGDYPIPGESILLLNPMSLHYIDYVRDSGLCDRYVLMCPPELVTDLGISQVNLLGCFLRHGEDCMILKPSPDMIPEILFLLDSMEKHLHQPEASSSAPSEESGLLRLKRLYPRLQLCQLLILVNQLYFAKRQETASVNYQRHSQTVSRICSYIDTHLEEELSIDDLAKRFYISKTSLYNITREILEMSLNEYIAKARINMAKALLAGTDYSIEIISQKIGYASISSFSRFFKAKTGAAPLQYRKQQTV